MQDRMSLMIGRTSPARGACTICIVSADGITGTTSPLPDRTGYELSHGPVEVDCVGAVGKIWAAFRIATVFVIRVKVFSVSRKTGPTSARTLAKTSIDLLED